MDWYYAGKEPAGYAYPGWQQFGRPRWGFVGREADRVQEADYENHNQADWDDGAGIGGMPGQVGDWVNGVWQPRYYGGEHNAQARGDQWQRQHVKKQSKD